MAYQVNKTDGTILTTLADGQIDQISTDITLIGKNYSGFGEQLNENLVHMLENFANTSEPENPIRGQLWFDTRDLKLKVYVGNQFIPVSSATISRTQPSVLNAGDLWYDESRGQLFFFDGNALKLLGPDWSTSQGQSGLITGNIFDTTNNNRVVVYLYCGGVLLGIFAKDTFTPRDPIAGFSGTIVPGFNVSTLPGVTFNVTVGDSNKLGGEPAASYLRSDIDSEKQGKLSIKSNSGLSVGSSDQFGISINENNVLSSVKKLTNVENFINVDTNNRVVDFYVKQSAAPIRPDENNPVFESIETYDTPRPYFRFAGDVKVFGQIDWQTAGTLTTFNQVFLNIENKLINLAEGSTSDDFSSGGGIILKGTNDHSLIWTEETFAWNSSEHVNLVSSPSVASPEYKINGVTVLTENSLGPSITSAPGLNRFGVQEFVELGRQSVGGALVAVSRLQGTRFSVLETNGNIELEPNGTGNVVLVGSPRIVGLENPSEPQDAATKSYVDDKIESRSLVFSMDLSDNKNNDYLLEVLTVLAPPKTSNSGEYANGTTARILCTIQTNLARQININDQLNITSGIFLTPPTGTGQAITSVSINSVTVPGSETAITRIVKTFRISQGQWIFLNEQQV
jgi:hypothetical protein